MGPRYFKLGCTSKHLHRITSILLALTSFLSYICLHRTKEDILKRQKTMVQEGFFQFRRSFLIWQKQTVWTKDEGQEKGENDSLLLVNENTCLVFQIKFKERWFIYIHISTCQDILNILNKPSPPSQNVWNFFSIFKVSAHSWYSCSDRKIISSNFFFFLYFIPSQCIKFRCKYIMSTLDVVHTTNEKQYW